MRESAAGAGKGESGEQWAKPGMAKGSDIGAERNSRGRWSGSMYGGI